ncbi:DNA polymerase III subunit beta [Psychrobacillus sp. FJAT-21963]|uniref:DNA polymerase III subunit beta n=1 Tax=unclassified Psychrobacillus TaxID=2636677 RepID=UPI0006FAB0AC|nr:DNA polymerase III subunit beta [Psychrobacillus sp. FJAT-21963]KQL35143.1 DNA polymerase III subunit beta [Psychrobacillus sp. FJAT-21963]
MKFEMMRHRLLDGLNDVMKAVSSKTTIPILTGIKLELTEEGLHLTGSDSDVTIQTFIKSEEDGDQVIRVIEEGSIVLQARMFNEIVRKLPTSDVEIEVKENNHTYISSGKSEFHIIGLDPSDYPLLPEIQDDSQFEIGSDLLKSLVRETVFAVSASESRPVLTGVHWQIKDGELTCVATDSHRLARRKLILEQPPEGEFNVVIPGKSLNELSKIIGDSAQPVYIVMTSQQVLFKTKDVLFYSRLLEGNYPDTSRLIPIEYKTILTLNSKALYQSIDRASLLAREERNNIVRLSSLEGKKVEVSSSSPEIGNVEEEIELSTMEGEGIKISFSAKYMMDALKAFDGQDIVIQLTGAMRPFIINSAQDDTLLQLIVPVRTY